MAELRTLILEDSATDAELAVFELERAGLRIIPHRVSTRDTFIAALEELKPDVVLADYSLPHFNGSEALQWTIEHFPQIPVIIVSGALGDERAIELIKAGACDYVLKTNLVRLGPAVMRALEDVRQVQAREEAQRALAAAAIEREKILATLEQRVEERTAQLRALAFELTKTEERERQAIARDLHDSLGQTLAIAKLKLDSLPAETKNPDTAKTLATVIKLIDESNQSVRSLAAQLSPSVLYDLGLVPALEWLAEQEMRDFGLHCRIAADEFPQRLDQSVGAIVFRAVRELLLNIVKHADNAEAPVDILVSVLAATDAPNGIDTLRVVVKDAGRGFDPNVVKSSTRGGFGLMSVRERLTYIGGTVDIVSELGKGTTVTLTAPLQLSNE